MGNQHQNGFTIIEVSLFLALSALLAVILLGGWTQMIDTQRYRDSNRTLQSFVQQQYNLVYNVENGRSGDYSCTNGNVSEDGVNGVERGRTDCVLMGRYIDIQDGAMLRVSAIVGSEVDNDTSADDAASMLLRNPKTVVLTAGLTETEFPMPWGATVVNPANEQPRNIAIAIVRSPLTGIVHTYVNDYGGGSAPTVQQIIQPANESSDTELCLEPGTNFAGGRMGIRINKYASSQSFVEAIGDKENAC